MSLYDLDCHRVAQEAAGEDEGEACAGDPRSARVSRDTTRVLRISSISFRRRMLRKRVVDLMDPPLRRDISSRHAGLEILLDEMLVASHCVTV